LKRIYGTDSVVIFYRNYIVCLGSAVLLLRLRKAHFYLWDIFE